MNVLKCNRRAVAAFAHNAGNHGVYVGEFTTFIIMNRCSIAKRLGGNTVGHHWELAENPQYVLAGRQFMAVGSVGDTVTFRRVA